MGVRGASARAARARCCDSMQQRGNSLLLLHQRVRTVAPATRAAYGCLSRSHLHKTTRAISRAERSRRAQGRLGERRKRQGSAALFWFGSRDPRRVGPRAPPRRCNGAMMRRLISHRSRCEQVCARLPVQGTRQGQPFALVAGEKGANVVSLATPRAPCSALRRTPPRGRGIAPHTSAPPRRAQPRRSRAARRVRARREGTPSLSATSASSSPAAARRPPNVPGRAGRRRARPPPPRAATRAQLRTHAACAQPLQSPRS